ncbi:small serum protein 5-like [Heteronotia binoei]|uniref:small serum protein 5-like n=1 Tax=Heteronotia binoei TaxID=13085 RepID=UPI0029304A18|nr:small serum protein 5-like [Heteronotia binoei]
MKVLLVLSVLCITLALCQAACYNVLAKVEIINGVLVPRGSCIDVYDGNRHPSDSEWNTDQCMRCSCHAGKMTCCSRYGGAVPAAPGCKAVVNPETCQHEFTCLIESLIQ